MSITRYLLIFLVCFITGCSTIVTSSISTFRNDELSLGKGTIWVTAESEELAETLEFRFYKTRLQEHLVKLGYSVAERADAEYVAYLGYGVEILEEDPSRGTVVWNAGYGYGRPSRYGHVIVTDTTDLRDLYVRHVEVRIDANQPVDEEAPYKNKLIQVKASSKGKCEHLSAVYDEILEAIFRNLDRTDGSIERVSVKGEAKCR